MSVSATAGQPCPPTNRQLLRFLCAGFALWAFGALLVNLVSVIDALLDEVPSGIVATVSPQRAKSEIVFTDGRQTSFPLFVKHDHGFEWISLSPGDRIEKPFATFSYCVNGRSITNAAEFLRTSLLSIEVLVFQGLYLVAGGFYAICYRRTPVEDWFHPVGSALPVAVRRMPRALFLFIMTWLGAVIGVVIAFAGFLSLVVVVHNLMAE